LLGDTSSGSKTWGKKVAEAVMCGGESSIANAVPNNHFTHPEWQQRATRNTTDNSGLHFGERKCSISIQSNHFQMIF
jgi:hypothetical protein